MPAGCAIQGDMLSGIEEEMDLYEVFQTHVDRSSISLPDESSPGEFTLQLYLHTLLMREINI